MKKTVGDMLVERLIDWGVEIIFGLPGDGVNGIFEALRTRQKQIRFIQVRHEESAAFAACGYAKYTGRLGVCSISISTYRRTSLWFLRPPQADERSDTNFRRGEHRSSPAALRKRGAED